MQYKVLSPIKLGGKLYRPDELIDLPIAVAAELYAAGLLTDAPSMAASTLVAAADKKTKKQGLSATASVEVSPPVADVDGAPL